VFPTAYCVRRYRTRRWGRRGPGTAKRSAFGGRLPRVRKFPAYF